MASAHEEWAIAYRQVDSIRMVAESLFEQLIAHMSAPAPLRHAIAGRARDSVTQIEQLLPPAISAISNKYTFSRTAVMACLERLGELMQTLRVAILRSKINEWFDHYCADLGELCFRFNLEMDELALNPAIVSGLQRMPLQETKESDSTPTATDETSPAAEIAQLKALMGAEELKIQAIASDPAKSSKQKRLEIIQIDQRYKGWNSVQWSQLLNVSDAQIRRGWSEEKRMERSRSRDD